MPVQGNLLKVPVKGPVKGPVKVPVKGPVKVPAVSNELSMRHSWAHQPQVGQLSKNGI